MRKLSSIIAAVAIVAGLFFEPAIAYADSPLTSTPFSKAYYDVEIVEKASRRNHITEDMAAYLADENNPIDVKAALINALSWDLDGKDNTDRYCRFIYGKPLEEIDVAALSGDQQFCIGYLLAMDDIDFHTAQSMECLRLARINMPDSLTVAVITYIVEAMNGEVDDWRGQLNQILADTSLKQDLSEDAIKVITDYMLLGIDNPVNIPKTGTTSYAAVYGIVAIALLAGALYLNHKRKR